MTPFKPFIVKVTQWDFEQDGEIYQPSAREQANLDRPFVVMCASEEEALNEVTSRTGWCIKEAIFLQ